MKSFLHKNDGNNKYYQLDEIVSDAMKFLKAAFADAKVNLQSKVFGSNIVAYVDKSKIESPR